MDQVSRDEIGAAIAAHAELGREYDRAVAEGLIDRIGAEVDRRVDQRLSGASRRALRSGRPGTFATLVMGLGSMGLGVGGTAVVLSNTNNNSAALLMVIVIWIAIAVINVTFGRRDFR